METRQNSENFHSVNGKRQVLVVDDEMINREILGEYLSGDYDVLFAADGMQAMEVIHEHRDTLSLILLDLLMPVMSGKEVLQRVRDNVDLAHIPVIVMTADQESEVECLNLGAVDFIPKPYPQVSVVLARILRTIELYEDRRIIQVTERDSLTGLYTKDFFYRYAEQFDRHHKNTEMDAIIIDIYHFRVINERYGKAYGDEILKQIGQNIREQIRTSGGIVSRREADTFLIYCPHRDDYREMLEAISDGLLGNDASGSRLRLRMGVYSVVDKTIDIERRFDRAKAAADTIRGSYVKPIGIYDQELNDRELFAAQLIDDFETALEEKQFQVYYQPKFDVRPEKPILTSAEALVRWLHPRLGMVNPGMFVPLFENNGLVQKLDVYVWRETARQIREWKDTLGYWTPVSVNVSRIDLYDPGVIETLTEIVDTYGLEPQDLLLEITESAYTQDSTQIIEMVKKLRGIGFRIEMDDFGTGYSSLNMISKLPIDAMKLDMQFIRNAFREGGDSRMLDVILEIAGYLSVPVVAEGVETLEQLNALKTLGCDIVQGFYFSKPVCAADFLAFLQEGKIARSEAEAADLAAKKAAESRTIQDIIEPQMQAKIQINEIAAVSSRPVGTERRHEQKGYSLRLMSCIFMVAAFLTAAALFLSDSSVTKGYKRMLQASKRFITAQQAASAMEIGSDYLTDRVRSFAFAGDMQYMLDYFDELNVTRRRENALSTLEELLEGNDNSAYERLADALNLSNELVNREYYSMRLMVESGDYDPDLIPDEVSSFSLSREDLELDPELQREKAQNLVFDDYYMDYKEHIRENVRLCTEDLIRNASEELEQASVQMSNLLRIQTVLTFILLIIVLGFVGFIEFQVRRPLTRMVAQMKSQKAVSPNGAKELQFVTRTYNEILLENMKAHAQLKYDASHDPLTGLFNRGAYEMLMKSVDADNIALIMIDVDDFKTINDSYGHDVGDVVLRKVADVLEHSFRSVDVVCRIGGDEFVVIMTRANSSMRQIVQNKILQANNQLKNPKDNIPPVSLSVGVAFSDRDNPQGNIFKDADTALYRSKQGGKGRCEIY